MNLKPILIEDADDLPEAEKCFLKKKIDVLFDNAVTSSDQVTPVNRLKTLDAKDDIIQWGQAEFGLTDGDKRALDDIYSQIDSQSDTSFSKQELYRHIKDANENDGKRELKW